MTRLQAGVVALAAVGATLLGSGTANAAAASTVPASCSNSGTIHIFVPYTPYTYCYSGFGSRNINLNQVETVESRNWNVTVLWKSTNGHTYQTGLVAHSSLHVGGGKVYTIAVP